MTYGFEPPVTETSNHSTWLTKVPKIFGYNTCYFILFHISPCTHHIK